MITTDIVKQFKQSNVSKDFGKSKTRVSDVFGALTNAKKNDVIKLSGQSRNSIYRVKRAGNVSAKILLPLAEIAEISPFYLSGEADEPGTFTEAVALDFLRAHNYAKLADSLSGVAPKKTRKPRAAKAAASEESAPEAVKPARRTRKKAEPKAEPQKRRGRAPKAAVAAEAVIAEPVIVEPVTVVEEKPAKKTRASRGSKKTKNVRTAKAAPKTVRKAIPVPTEDVTESEMVFELTEQMKEAVNTLSAEQASTLLNALFLRAQAGGKAAQLAEVVKYCLLV